MAFVTAVARVSAAEDAGLQDWQGVSRIVAVGDVHGDYDNYLKVLREAELVDRRGHWIGGETHLVQLGDVPDRGPETDRILRHLMQLEAEAQEAGGHVHALIGNHEAMNITGDLRYVHPGEYKALTDRRSKRLRRAYLERVIEYLEAQDDPAVEESGFADEWLEAHPLGWVEHRQLWSPQGEFGAWVTSHNTVIRINRTLFVHGGISPRYLNWPLGKTNAQVRAELSAGEVSENALVADEEGPLWYRGLSAAQESDDIARHVGRVLEVFDVDRIVVGHTPGFATVVPHYESRVLAADSGISEHYGGYRASVLIEGDEAFTLQGGQRIRIPEAGEGGDALLRYYQQVNAVQPGVNNILYMIEKLGSP